MKPKYLALFISSLLLIGGCSDKEEKLTPTTEPEPVYNGANTLPQGNHAYDAGIVEFFQKYGTIILYKYDENEIFWQRSISLERSVYNATANTSTKGYFVTAPDENYVGQQLQLLYETLNQFPEEVVMNFLPRRIFLADTFIKVTTEGEGTPQERPHDNVAYYVGPDYLLITGGSQRILTMTYAEKKLITGGIFSELFKPRLTQGYYPMPAEFAKFTNYSLLPSSSWTNYYRIHGCLIYSSSSTAEKDWNTYIEQILTLPYDKWMTLASSNTNTQIRQGFMDPVLDTNKAVRTKYKFVLDHFKNTYGIDLFGVLNEGTFVF